MTLNPNDSEEPNPLESAGEHEAGESASEDESSTAEEAPQAQTQSVAEPAPVSKPKSGVSGKVIAAVVVVLLLGVGGLIFQTSSSKARTVKLTPHDMQVIFQELVPPQKQQQFNSDPE